MTTTPTPSPLPNLTPRQISDAIRASLRPSRRPVALSPADATSKAAAYRNSLAHYRQHAHDSLTQGDYRQAAEKSWGAYTQTIKAIAADHSSLIPTHAAILRVSQQLTTLVDHAGHPDRALTLTRGLLAARALHTHFYENDLPDQAVILAADDVTATIDLLQQLFAPETAP